MASDFYRLGNRSMLDLLKSSGYHGYYLLPPGVSPNRGSDWVVGYHPVGRRSTSSVRL